MTRLKLRRQVVRRRRWLARIWRQSLRVRVVVTTMVLGLGVVTLLGALLRGQIADSLQAEKLNRSKYEALNLANQAQAQWDSKKPDANVDALNLAANDIMLKVLKPPAPDPDRFVLMQRSRANTSTTVLAFVESGALGPDVIPDRLRQAVGADPTHQQTMVDEITIDGTPTPSVVIGSRITIPSAGPYDLYFVYPLTLEEATMSLISRAFLGAGVVLTLLVGAVAFVVTRQVVTPVRRAAGVAERLSSGHLNERMPVSGEDDLALLATSFNEMADSLQSQIRQLEGLSQVQQRFVSDVSHELRTPLTTIRMAADLIHEAREDFAAPVSRSAELLHGQLDRFESLLGDLLEISRFDAGAAALDVEAIDLRTTVEQVVRDASPLAARRGSDLRVKAPSTPTVAEVDERRVQRILRNLVVNAVEHGNGRPIRIVVAADEGSVAVVVEDEGVGLGPGEAALVFTRFWRADPARARTTGGTGLGLAISLEDARLHNGWLQAWGRKGVGSRFRLTLPSHAGASLTGSPLPLAGTEKGPR